MGKVLLWRDKGKERCSLLANVTALLSCHRSPRSSRTKPLRLSRSRHFQICQWYPHNVWIQRTSSRSKKRHPCLHPDGMTVLLICCQEDQLPKIDYATCPCLNYELRRILTPHSRQVFFELPCLLLVPGSFPMVLYDLALITRVLTILPLRSATRFLYFLQI